jgi:hypothetical protein
MTKSGTIEAEASPFELIAFGAVLAGATSGRLYEDSVSVHEPFESGKVAFEPLRGVTPNSFSGVFKKGRRKKANGTAVTWDRESAEPIFTTSFAYYPQAETRLVAELGRVVKDISEGSIAGAVELGPNSETGESVASK